MAVTWPKLDSLLPLHAGVQTAIGRGAQGDTGSCSQEPGAGGPVRGGEGASPAWPCPPPRPAPRPPDPGISVQRSTAQRAETIWEVETQRVWREECPQPRPLSHAAWGRPGAAPRAPLLFSFTDGKDKLMARLLPPPRPSRGRPESAPASRWLSRLPTGALGAGDTPRLSLPGLGRL